MTKKVYIAGGWFSDAQLTALKELEELYPEKVCYRPRLDTNLDMGWDKIFQDNLKYLEECEIVIASTIDKDMGTLWECGYAYAKNKTIVYYTPGISKPNLMLGKSGVICQTIQQIKTYLTFGIVPEVQDYE